MNLKAHLQQRRALRRSFLLGMIRGLHVVWPVLSAIIGLIVVLGVVVGLCENWSILDSIYFAFVTGMTIGYGDLTPKTPFGRALAIFIGACGILLTALVAAVAVKALTGAVAHDIPGHSQDNDAA